MPNLNMYRDGKLVSSILIPQEVLDQMERIFEWAEAMGYHFLEVTKP